MVSLASRLKSTILITGGNGSLGSEIALQIAKSRPGKHHLILTARRFTDPRTITVSSALKSLNASFDFQTLDLSSLEDIHSFAANLKERIGKKEIPPFDSGGIVLSAAMNTQSKDDRTVDGWHSIYGINVLGSILLVRELLSVLGSALVINIASAAHSMGTVDHFSSETTGEAGGAAANEVLGLGETMKRYGASKLWAIMSFYALQRRLDTVGTVVATHSSSSTPFELSLS